MKILRMIIVLLGVIMEVLFTLPLLTYGILNIGNATGIIIGAAFLTCGLLFDKIKILFRKLWTHRVLRGFMVIFGGGFIGLIILAIVITAFIITATFNKPVGDETVIVLGCQVKGTSPSLMLNERLIAAKDYLDSHENAICILSGGQGPDEDISEADCMYNYLVKEGISPGRLIKEDKSTSTRENLKFSLDIIEEHNLNANVAIVTNEFHEYRASAIAKKLGIKSYAISAHTHFHLLPTYFVREWYGVMYEWAGMR